jgi:acetylornithine/N-succinyldiaminopimelate aminotransferase
MSSILPVYRRSDITMVRGEGVYLYADTGKEYLDFAAGIAVNSLGHSHPKLVEALKEQAEKLWHCSNLYFTDGLIKLADRLIDHSCADKVFFCCTGLEAVECGIKMTRRYHYIKGNPQKNRIITMEGGFHGRSLATIFAGGNKAIQEGFEPRVDGFEQVAFNDIEVIKEAITEETAGVLIEPIQGEGGVRVADKAYLHALRDLCHAHDILLFFDEIQCGMGRSGALFIHEQMDVKPDIISIAKGIGSGFPLGACLANDKAASGMTPGSHGSTYGSNPLAMAVGNAVLDIMLEEGFISHVVRMGALLKQQLTKLSSQHPSLVKEVRGEGLILGLVLEVDNYAFCEALRHAGLLTAAATNNTIRIVPPLIIQEKHVEKAVSIINEVCEQWDAN